MKDVFELTYRYVIPSIRGLLARELIRKGILESEAAEVLGLSRSAISRYLKAERGSAIRVAQFKDVLQLIEELAEDITYNKLGEYEVQEEINKIASYFMSKKYFCKFHSKIEPKIDTTRCRICPTVFSSKKY
ncbi:MAG: transcriptional regulator [Thermoproteota archaeon]|nr:transcriptional regulator [Candidatus Brockarchaeota archaeon]MBO3762656.1 transcriptional regulator [Candidatus Brockarchaeota archaeon]MBO3768515.1 transcriptional regulator [Candidatus Brockarchaeota archaeon]MBO3801401.1 transcriptional regulator [Candidatus Brockarchaeota archaeon]